MVIYWYSSCFISLFVSLDLNLYQICISLTIESNCWIFGVFGIGYHYLNKPSALLSYLSQAAYPVYIIHMFVLFAGALIILPLDIHPLLKFIGITLFTFIVCFLIYEFILKRINILRPLFGLKWKFNTEEKKVKVISKPVELNLTKKKYLYLIGFQYSSKYKLG